MPRGIPKNGKRSNAQPSVSPSLEVQNYLSSPEIISFIHTTLRRFHCSSVPDTAQDLLLSLLTSPSFQQALSLNYPLQFITACCRNLSHKSTSVFVSLDSINSL